MTFAPPAVVRAGGLRIVRDDLLHGGTKRRALDPLLRKVNPDEVVYAGPQEGYAQVALAATCKDKRLATSFVAARKERHRNVRLAAALGANIVEVRPGYLSVVRARATAYAESRGAFLLPFGIDTAEARGHISEAAESMLLRPEEVWCVAGSGMLTRSLQEAWPDARHIVVQIGRELSPADAGRAEVMVAPERFADDARCLPPYPSCRNYDAKLWAFVSTLAAPGAVVWNVAP